MSQVLIFLISFPFMIVTFFKNTPWSWWQKKRARLLATMPFKPFIYLHFILNASFGFVLLLSSQYVYFEIVWLFLGSSYIFKSVMSQIHYYFFWKPFHTVPNKITPFVLIEKLRFFIPILFVISWLKPLVNVELGYSTYSDQLISITLIVLFVFIFLFDVIRYVKLRQADWVKDHLIGNNHASFQGTLSPRIRSLLRLEWEKQFPEISNTYSHWKILGDGDVLDIVPGNDLRKALQIVENNFGNFGQINAVAVSVDKFGHLKKDAGIQSSSISNFKTDDDWIWYFEHPE